MRDLPMVRPALKEKIQAVAQQLGYHPDPALAALVAYRTGKHPTKALSNLALLVPATDAPVRATNSRTRFFDEHLKQAAERLGYCLEIVLVQQGVKDDERIQRMLLARGIRGLILSAEIVSPMDLQLEWSHFACVQILGYHSDHFHHAICRNEHLDMTTVMEEIQAHGYRRPAFVMGISPETPHFSLKRAIFEAALMEMGIGRPRDFEFLYPHTFDWESREFARWVKKKKPDVLVSDTGDWTIETLRRDGVIVPDQIGFISTSVPYAGSNCSGIRVDVMSQARLCMDILHGQLLRSECGLPEIPMAVELRGLWQMGSTLGDRRQVSTTAASTS